MLTSSKNASNRRRPHILTFEEEDRVLAAAVPHIRALAVLILETGMRSRREALSLLWSDVDLVHDIIRVRGARPLRAHRAARRWCPSEQSEVNDAGQKSH
jgi:integrase